MQQSVGLVSEMAQWVTLRLVVSMPRALGGLSPHAPCLLAMEVFRQAVDTPEASLVELSAVDSSERVGQLVRTQVDDVLAQASELVEKSQRSNEQMISGLMTQMSSHTPSVADLVQQVADRGERGLGEVLEHCNNMISNVAEKILR